MDRRWSYLLWVPFLALLFILTFRASAATPYGELQVSFINVGEGDAALIHDSTGYNVLIDGGKPDQGPVVLSYLRRQGIDDIDTLLVTHSDSDHVGGLIDVLNAADIPVRQVLYNGYPGTTSTWFTFATAVASEGVTMTAAQFPQTYSWGGVTAHILNPVPGLMTPESNDASVVALLDYGDNRFLFTGDIDSTVEAQIVARKTPIAADVLKVAHHGSSSSSGESFLKVVSPQDAVISVGPNTYGHPSPDTFDRLATVGTTIWRTDLPSDIVMFSDGAAYRIYNISMSRIVYLPFGVHSLPPEVTSTPIPTNAHFIQNDIRTPAPIFDSRSR